MCGCSGGHMCGCSGGHAWLLRGVCMVALGGMHGCSRGRGHAWLLTGGMHGCSRGVHGCLGVCMVALGGMHGCSWGVCVVAPGEVCHCSWGGVHGIRRDTEIQPMSGWYASYWNASLFYDLFLQGQGAVAPSAPRIRYCHH